MRAHETEGLAQDPERKMQSAQDPDRRMDPAQNPERESQPDQPRSRKSRGKRPAQLNGHRTPSPAPLTRWPPKGIAFHEQLSPSQAAAWICRGVPIHQGHKRPIPYRTERGYALYTTTTGNREAGRDVADLHDSMTHLMTMKMQSEDYAMYPWETLEQPSYSFHYGQQPGTITLNHWASMASVIPSTAPVQDSRVMIRPLSLERIFERLGELRAGLEDDDLDLLYRILYKRMLRDPDRILNPHKTLEKQIADLIDVLSWPSWTDFSDPKNQPATRFMLDGGQWDNFAEKHHKVFHQLLLSLELEMRIHSREYGELAKEKKLRQIPPSIQWNLALARRWRQYVRIEDFGNRPEDSKFSFSFFLIAVGEEVVNSVEANMMVVVKLRYKLKKRQVKMLRRFAQMMKWPNLAGTLERLKQKDDDFTLDEISSDAFAFFSGLVLPGVSDGISASLVETS